MNHFSKTIASGLLMLALPLATTAQTHLKRAFDNFARNNSANVQKEFYQNKDPETGKKTAQCDIYRFKIHGRQGQSIVGQLKEAFEQDRDEAYTIASGDGREPTEWEEKSWAKLNTHQPAVTIAVGDGSSRSIGLGYQGTKYIYSLFLDPQDTEKNYRYAYAMEWKEESDTISGKLVVTYALRQEKRKGFRTININGFSLDDSQLDAIGSMMDSLQPTLSKISEWGEKYAAEMNNDELREEAAKVRKEVAKIREKTAKEKSKAAKKARKEAEEKATKSKAAAKRSN